MRSIIQHRGIVERIDGDKVFVKVDKESACQACHAKGLCGERGGVRIIEGLPAGDVTIKTLFDNEPFFSQVHTLKMTPAQLRKLIVMKYNDTVNTKESHRVDLYATTPYTIVVDENDEAYDVLFPELKEGQKYQVAIADYVARNYPNLECENEVRTPLLVYDLDVAYFKANSPVTISSESKQSVIVRKKR